MAVTDIHDRLQQVVEEAGLPFAEIEAGGAEGSHLQFSHGADAAADPGESLVLVASITKSVVATLALKLAAQGVLSLSQRVTHWLSDLPAVPFRRITLRHLLTHTAGLPDQLPGHEQIRADHADLNEFVRRVGEYGTDYAPGTDCRYSSMGFLLLGACLHRALGGPLPDALRDLLFRPAGMHRSWLGIPADRDDLLEQAMPCQLPAWQDADCDWGWNSPYWRRLGAPWGGLLTTAGDLGRLCRVMLRRGVSDDGADVLAPAAVDALVQEQTRWLFDLPESVWRRRPWGYGWRFPWPEHPAGFGDLVPRSAVGHWGATGTVFWLDPHEQIYAVLLTTTPFEDSRTALQRLSNAIVGALRV